MRFVPALLLTLILVPLTLLTITSCSSVKEIEHVQRETLIFDMSPPLPQNSGIKVKIPQPVPAISYVAGKDPVPTTLKEGVYVVQGVEVYRRMYALIGALKELKSELPSDFVDRLNKRQQELLKEF